MTQQDVTGQFLANILGGNTNYSATAPASVNINNNGLFKFSGAGSSRLPAVSIIIIVY